MQSPREWSSCWTAALLWLAGQANSTGAGKYTSVHPWALLHWAEQTTPNVWCTWTPVFAPDSPLWGQDLYMAQKAQVGQVLTPLLLPCLETWEMEVWSFPFSWLNALFHTEAGFCCSSPQSSEHPWNNKCLTSADPQAQQILYNTSSRACQCRLSIKNHPGTSQPDSDHDSGLNEFYYCDFCQMLT